MIARRTAALLAIVVAASVAGLGGVAWNRSAEESVVTLTERELGAPSAYHLSSDDTGLSLRLDWASEIVMTKDGFRSQDIWFDEAKLCAVGFDCRVPADHESAARVGPRMLAKSAFVVFELDGPAWGARLDGRAAHATAEYAQKTIARDRVSASRLAPIDVGRDAAALRGRYADRSRYVILPAVVDISVQKVDGQFRLIGTIREVFPQTIHVPREHRAVFDAIREADAKKPPSSEPYAAIPPRYAVTLRIGRRFEPWIDSVRRLEPQS